MTRTAVLGRAGIWALAMMAGATACAVGEAPPPLTPEVVVEGPAIRDGLRDPAEARRAAELLADGERALTEGDSDRALALAREVEANYSEALGSARALWLGARARHAAGAYADAAEWAQRYRARIGDFPELAGRVDLFRARALHDAGLPGAVEALFGIPETAGEAVLTEASEVAGIVASGMTVPALRDLTLEAPSHPQVLPPFLAELGVRRFRTGNPEEARQLALRALALSPAPGLAETLQGLVEGRVPGESGVLGTLGTLLPESGSPSMQELAREIRDGVELALAMDGARGLRPIRLQTEDTQGDAGRAAQGMATLERSGAFGVVGPLTDGVVSTVTSARTGRLPILSPTARMVPTQAGGVLSLTGVDPGAAEALALLVRRQGVRGVVVFHARTSEMEQEVAWFREMFLQSGGEILRTISYAPGTTNFPSEMELIVRTAPQGLVLFLPPEHIGQVGPQIAYHGVDDLEGLRIFGNDAWSTQGVLESVNPRHTNGVFTITSRDPSRGYGPGWDEFVLAYEEHFRRTLHSPVPALGYDAARLLLLAGREGGGTPEGTAVALEGIRNFPGATGLLSVVEGRIRRVYLPVRIENRRPILLP